MVHKCSVNVPQYFLDDSLISHHKRLVRRWIPTTVFHEPVVRPDKPWERHLGYLSILAHPEDGYRMYYWKFDPRRFGTNARHSQSMISMATSKDGFHWEKPNLGLVEWEGSRENNIVMAPEWHCDGHSVVYDPGSPEPYKMVMFHLRDDDWSLEKWGLYVYTSADGLRWTRHPGDRLLPGCEANDVMTTRVNGKWVNFTRSKNTYNMIDDYGRRVIYRSESDDFIHWTPQEMVLAPDLADEPDTEFYCMSVFERNGWYFGLISYWDGLRDVIETHLAISRDTKNWIRTSRQPFIASRCDWNRRWSIPANTGPVIMEEQMVFYFNGWPTAHNWNTAQRYGAIGYASLELDRFCALEGTSDGFLETVPMVWPGGELLLNADSRGSYDRHPIPHVFAGQIEIEVLDAQGKPLPDYSGVNRVTWRGNTHCREHKDINALVNWPGERKLDTLRGQTIRLRFLIKQARLFTFSAKEA